MNTISDILKLAEQVISESLDAVLATVVHTEGSAYRKAGAMMLICEDGRSAGMISGGCVEPHIIKKAFWLTRHGSIVQVYQTGEDNEAVNNNNLSIHEPSTPELELNFGIGCNGKIHVLFERMISAASILEAIKNVRHNSVPITVATLVRSDIAEHPIGMHVDLDRSLRANKVVTLNELSGLVGSDLEPILIEALRRLNSTQQKDVSSYFVSLHDVIDNDLQQPVRTEWLVRHLKPQMKLLICGAGNDVVPLVAMAKMQDWHVTVVDSRSHYATRSRFLKADKVLCLPLEEKERLIELSRDAAVAVMSHSLAQDKARLSVLLLHPPKYLGQLGPKYRTERLISEILEEANDKATSFSQGINKLHYPIGYKVGGEGPEALALSIMVQISAVMHDVPFTGNGPTSVQKNTPCISSNKPIIA